MDSLIHRDFRLGEYEVRPLEGQIIGPDGVAHAVEPNVMRVLTCLAEHAPNDVSRDEILDRVWSGQKDADTAIFRSISELRRVLGDDVAQPRFIKTIPRRGYRLVVNVETISGVGEKTGVFAKGRRNRQRRLLLVAAGFLFAAVSMLVGGREIASAAKVFGDVIGSVGSIHFVYAGVGVCGIAVILTASRHLAEVRAARKIMATLTEMLNNHSARDAVE